MNMRCTTHVQATITNMQDKYIVVPATIFTLFKANTKETTEEVAAEGRHLCILAMKKVSIVGVTTQNF